MVRIISAVLLGLLVVVSASSVLAEKRQSKSTREKAAKKACALGDFQKGADILTDLFVETDDPVYVYNQGRCYQQNSRWEQAITRFQEFLRKGKDFPEADRAEAERQIADCEKALAKTAALAPPTPAPPPASPNETAVPVSRPTTVEIVPPPPSPSDDSRGKGWRVAGVILSAVGIGALGTGIGLALKANSLSATDYSRSREDERSSLKTWALVGYGVGGAAIAAGAALYIVGWTSKSSSNVAFLPCISSDGASAFFQGSF